MTANSAHHWPGIPGYRCLSCGGLFDEVAGQPCSGSLMERARSRTGGLPGLAGLAAPAGEARFRIDEIREWWGKTSSQDLERTADKALEYGGTDLEIMGVAMEALIPGHADLDDQSRKQAGLEMAIAFYTLGKISRLFGAYQQGHTPGPDTWHDLTIYSMMARCVRETGRWT